MVDKLFDFIKEKNKFLYSFIMAVIIILLSMKFWSLVEKSGTALLETLKIIIPHLLSIAFTIILFVGRIILFRYSDKKSQEKIDDYNKGISCESKKGKYISAKVFENKKSIDGKRGVLLEILINNISDQKIDFIKGFVNFYKVFENKRIFKVPFEIQRLKKSYNERIFYGFLERKNRNWDGFDIFIEKIQIEDKEECNQEIGLEWFTRTHYMELNLHRFYDFRFCGIKTKYNMVWLNDKLKREIMPFIRFFYSRRTYYIGGKPWYIGLRDTIISLLRFLLVLIVFLLTLSLFIFTIADIVKMIISIYSIWKAFFQQLVKII